MPVFCIHAVRLAGHPTLDLGQCVLLTVPLRLRSVRTQSVLSLTASDLSGNTARGIEGGVGGAIESLADSSVSLRDCTLARNSAVRVLGPKLGSATQLMGTNTPGGGAILSVDSTLAVVGTAFTGNYASHGVVLPSLVSGAFSSSPSRLSAAAYPAASLSSLRCVPQVLVVPCTWSAGLWRPASRHRPSPTIRPQKVDAPVVAALWPSLLNALLPSCSLS